MSKLDELIKKYCPDGVEYKKLGDIATISRGGNFQKKDYVSTGVPCIHYGQLYVHYNLFTDNVITYIHKDKAVKQKFAEPNDIIMAVTSENIEDVCKSIAWLGEKKVAVSGHSAIIHHSMNPKYLAYYLNSLHFYKQKVKLAHGTKVIEVTPSALNEVSLPVPPLPVQEEIVRILDSFTSLTAELQAELQARKKQYEYYRNILYTKHDYCPKKKLIDISDISRGIRVVKKNLIDDGKFPVYQNSLTPMGYYNKSNVTENTTYVISAGAAGEIGFCNTNFWAADDCLVFSNLKEIRNKYIYYFLLTKQDFIRSNVRKASVPRLSRTVIENLQIPIISLEEQDKILSLLDRFDTICNDITTGIPAEIAARQKQYEYYRDKLLTFKELS
ncbi:restriction endonuclease subunit S [Veillonellaceae bacterium WCA-693-APC-5D-A]|uniref:Restriction endonuclease subunit S n=1 Tax=Anaerovibrio slackiae TaxID=2652309 RepID=A0A6I2UM75_9FIRM|nr:restriction endonuclease subunit S [Anaerovibrio slackiae]MSU10052.1 restriction endonuclease subunit S [Anaerovibrio slackiae]